MRRKFVELNEVEKSTLREGRKNAIGQSFQQRCHCLLLSSEGYQVKALARNFQVSEITVYGWLRRWEKGGIVGLRDKVGRGRKAILQTADLPQIKHRVQENAQRLKVARLILKEELGRTREARRCRAVF